MSKSVVGGTGLTFGDVSRTMQAIEEHHQVTMSLTVTPLPGSAGGLKWTLFAAARLRLGDRDDPFNPLSWAIDWREDSPDLGKSASSLYRYLLKLDALLTEVRWRQSHLPEG